MDARCTPCLMRVDIFKKCFELYGLVSKMVQIRVVILVFGCLYTLCLYM